MDKPHPNKGRKQTAEQIRKRMEGVAKTKALWTSERHAEFVNKIREANHKRDPSWREKMAIGMTCTISTTTRKTSCRKILLQFAITVTERLIITEKTGKYFLMNKSQLGSNP